MKLSLLAATALALAPIATSAGAAAPITVPPLAFTQRTLANGLRVFAMPDRSGANVSVQMWYDVGGKDDPEGRSGFAHLFEHLMFKATRNLPAEGLMRLTEDVGGDLNASTDDDYTEYHEVAPANHLERLLWAEAERMGSLVIDQPTFAAERDVVKEELRGDEARPYDTLFRIMLPRASYRTATYARSPIGSIADLDAATVQDVRAFHALYYRPDNAVLVVSGNFDPAQLDRWVDRYLGAVKRPSWPIPRVTAAEPVRTRPQRYTLAGLNTPLPAVVISYPLPPAADADHAVVNVIDGILSGGESSRFYRSLVYRDRIASDAGLQVDFKKGSGVVAAYAIVAGGKDVGAAEAGLRREIAALRDGGVTADELARVKNQIVTGALKSRETAEGRAGILASSVIVDGDPQAADRRLAAIQAVTAADVQRVARTLLADDRAATVVATSQAAGATSSIPLAATVVAAPLVSPPDVPVVVAASPATRIQPPAPGPAVTLTTPTPIERRLANGMRLVVLPRRKLPIVTAYLVVDGGSATDPDAKAGLAEMEAGLLTKGTTTRSATDIAGTVESLGGSIGGDATRDGELLSLTVKSDGLQPAMAVFADVAMHPAFADAEIDRLRAQAIDGLKVDYSAPASLLPTVASRVVFGGGPYGKPATGTPTSLPRIGRADLIAQHDAAWRPDAATLVLAGDIDADGAERLANAMFGGWRAPSGPRRPAPGPGKAPAPRTVVVDMAAPQAAVMIARPAITRADPRYYAMTVANAALGGGFNSRLNQQVRVQRGLAYGASSSFQARRAPGPLAAATQTKNPTVPDVIVLMRAQMAGMGTEAVSAAELDARKAALTGGFGREIETTDGLAGFAAGLVLQGAPLSEIGAYVPSINAVGPADVQAVSKALIDPALASTIVVGHADEFAAGLTAKGIVAETIPVDRLNLDSPTLR